MYVQIWPDDHNSHSHYKYKKKTGRAKHVILFNNLSLGGPEAIYHSHDWWTVYVFLYIYNYVCILCRLSACLCVTSLMNQCFLGTVKTKYLGMTPITCLTLKTVSMRNNILIPGHHKISNLSSCSCVAWDVKNFVLYIVYGRFILQNYFNLIQL